MTNASRNASYFDLIKKPLVTEKCLSMSEKDNTHVFSVSDNADKLSIKRAIETIFQVKVDNVRILNVKGKCKRFKGVKGYRSDTKKAIVKLQKDCSIDLSVGSK